MKKWISRLGTVGHLARMVVFGLVGVFLIKAAVDYNPRKAVGLDGALAKIVHRLLRPVPARDRRDRTDRVRALLAQRRPLPQNLSASASGASRLGRLSRCHAGVLVRRSDHRADLRPSSAAAAADRLGARARPSGRRLGRRRPPARPGNAVEVLIDGAQALPAIAEELRRARSHVHLTGWHFSPDFALVRDGEPVVLRNLLAELAERLDVRVLVWAGAPLPLFRPSRGNVRKMREQLIQHTKIECALDAKERPLHCHHEKTIVIDDRVAFVGGIDLTSESGDRYDTNDHPRARGRRLARRLREDRGPGRQRCRRALPHALARSHRRNACPGRAHRAPPATSSCRSCAPCPSTSTQRRRAATSASSSPTSAPSKPPNSSSTSKTSSSGRPKSRPRSTTSSSNPPMPDFRLLLLLPAKPNSGADDTRGVLGELIEADADAGRLLACTLYARSAHVADPIYVHAKIAIIDDDWLTLGSANLNEHSLFNDTEMNLVTHDPDLARQTRLRLWAEHLELPIEEIPSDPTKQSTTSGNQSAKNNSNAETTANH